MKKYILIVLGLSLLLSEIILMVNPTWGFVFYALLISGCLISLSKAEVMDNYGKLIITLMILPTIRIAEFFIGFNFLWTSFITYYILGFLATFYVIKFKINPGYTKKLLGLLPLVIIIGGLLGILLNNFGLDKYPGFLLLLPIIVYSEEVLFRGLIQNFTKESYGAVSSILFTSALYFIFSLSFGLPIALLFFFVSLVSCIIYHFTRNIFLTMALSFGVHLFMLVI